jgi:hypothetical protein
MTLARSSPSWTLDQGFLTIARTSALGPNVFTMMLCVILGFAG